MNETPKASDTSGIGPDIGIGLTSASYGFRSTVNEGDVDSDTDFRWKELESLGEVEVRKRLAAHIWNERKAELARQWLAFRDSSNSEMDRRETLRLANEANDLARSANTAASEANVIARASAVAAKRSAFAAWTSNIIAAAALIAAIIAIVLSIIGKH